MPRKTGNVAYLSPKCTREKLEQASVMKCINSFHCNNNSSTNNGSCFFPLSNALYDVRSLMVTPKHIEHILKL